MLATLLTPGESSAHFRDFVYIAYEVPPGSIDVHDGHLEDWRRLVPGPSLRPANFFADPTAPRDGAADPGFNLDYHIWLAWSSDGKIYVAIERQGDVFLGHPTPPDDDDLWAYDGSVGIRVDGDHSGGPYVLDAEACPGCTDAELSERSYSQAQQYAALPAVEVLSPSGERVLTGSLRHPTLTPAEPGPVTLHTSAN